MTWMISASGSIYNPSVYIRVTDSDLQPSLACYNDVVSVYDGTYYCLYIYHFNWQNTSSLEYKINYMYTP